MVGVAKWLRQWVVVPSCAGSNPVAHPIKDRINSILF